MFASLWQWHNFSDVGLRFSIFENMFAYACQCFANVSEACWQCAGISFAIFDIVLQMFYNIVGNALQHLLNHIAGLEHST